MEYEHPDLFYPLDDPEPPAIDPKKCPKFGEFGAPQKPLAPPVLIIGSVSGEVDSSTTDIDISSITILQPPASAFSVGDAAPASVKNFWNVAAASSAPIMAWRNKHTDTWYGLPEWIVEQPIHYGKLPSGGVTNYLSDTRRKYTVTPCNMSGVVLTDDDGEDLEDIEVWTERRPGFATALFAEMVITYASDQDDNNIIISSHLDKPFGAVELWRGNPNNLGTDRPGWSLCTGLDNTIDLRGRVPVGFYPNGVPADSPLGNEGDYAAAGSGGRAILDVDEPENEYEIRKYFDVIGGVNAANVTGPTNGQTSQVMDHTHGIILDVGELFSKIDNRMPWRVITYIERTH